MSQPRLASAAGAGGRVVVAVRDAWLAARAARVSGVDGSTGGGGLLATVMVGGGGGGARLRAGGGSVRSAPAFGGGGTLEERVLMLGSEPCAGTTTRSRRETRSPSSRSACDDARCAGSGGGMDTTTGGGRTDGSGFRSDEVGPDSSSASVESGATLTSTDWLDSAAGSRAFETASRMSTDSTGSATLGGGFESTDSRSCGGSSGAGWLRRRAFDGSGGGSSSGIRLRRRDPTATSGGAAVTSLDSARLASTSSRLEKLRTRPSGPTTVQPPDGVPTGADAPSSSSSCPPSPMGQ